MLRNHFPAVQLLSDVCTVRAQWTFTFDRKNRLKSHTHGGTDDVTHLWSDGLGRVWQRWTYDSVEEEWSATLTPYNYDGSALAQEHLIAVSEVEEAWVYTYLYLTYDYLRHAAGTRQRKGQVDKSYTDYFVLSDMGTISGRFTRGSSVSLQKAQREIRGDRQARYSVAGGPPTTGDFTDVSNLGFGSTYIESFGGTKSGDAQFFDALNQVGSRHYLPGLGVYLNRRGNHPQRPGSGGELGGVPKGEDDGALAPGGGGEGEGSERWRRLPYGASEPVEPEWRGTPVWWPDYGGEEGEEKVEPTIFRVLCCCYEEGTHKWTYSSTMPCFPFPLEEEKYWWLGRWCYLVCQCLCYERDDYWIDLGPCPCHFASWLCQYYTAHLKVKYFEDCSPFPYCEGGGELLFLHWLNQEFPGRYAAFQTKCHKKSGKSEVLSRLVMPCPECK